MQVTPFKDSKLSKKSQIATMFNNISGRYDFLNGFLSFGIDRYWRRKVAQLLKKSSPKIILDAATGTAELAIEIAKINPEKIFGIDISTDMLAIGKQKTKNKKLSSVIELIEGDSENMIFVDNKFDAITVSFGVRNFENLLKGLQEFHRVLKPEGKIFILEFSQPHNKFIRTFYHFYSSKILPRLGKRISKDQVAYQYLHESVEAFPSGNDFLKILKQAGFNETNCKPLTFGIVSIYTGKK